MLCSCIPARSQNFDYMEPSEMQSTFLRFYQLVASEDQLAPVTRYLGDEKMRIVHKVMWMILDRLFGCLDKGFEVNLSGDSCWKLLHLWFIFCETYLWRTNMPVVWYGTMAYWWCVWCHVSSWTFESMECAAWQHMLWTLRARNKHKNIMRRLLGCQKEITGR